MAVVGVGVDAVLLSSTVIQTQFLFWNGVASVFGITVSSNTCKECMNLCLAFFHGPHYQSGVLCSRLMKILMQCFIQVISISV